METWEWIVIGGVALVAVLLAVAWMRIRGRRSHLKERFGPAEYHRAVSDAGTGAGERHLAEIEEERDRLDVKPLPRAARDRYLEEWRHAETRFVSDPREAARTADRLVVRALEERGYPADDHELVAALVSVDHPDIVDRYRHGHAMLDNVDGPESTENLRKAMLDFRAVLEEILQPAPTSH